MQPNSAVKPTRWLDRMFQMRFGMFMAIVAGFALVCWAAVYYRANSDVNQSMFSQRVRELSSPDVKTRRIAAYALDSLFVAQLSEGASALMGAMRDLDPEVRSASIASLSTSLMHFYVVTDGEVPPERDAASLRFVQALSDKDAKVRRAASLAFEVLLQPMPLNNGKVTSLGIDSSVVTDGLMKLIDSSDSTTVLRAYRVLEGLYLSSASANASFTSPVPKFDFNKIRRALRRVGQEKDRAIVAAVVPKIADTLREQDELPDEIIAFLSDQNAQVRAAAAQALAQPVGAKKPWGQTDTIACALVTRFFKARDSEVEQIVVSLQSLKSIPDDLVPVLIQALDAATASTNNRYSDQFIINELPIIIQYASPNAAIQELPALSRAFHKARYGSMNAASVIARLAPDSSEGQAIVTALAAQVTSHTSQLGQNKSRMGNFMVFPDSGALAAAETLAIFGPHAAKAAPALLELARAGGPYAQVSALGALRSIGAEAKFVVPTMRTIGEDFLVRDVFIEELYETILTLDPSSPEAAELLIKIALPRDVTDDCPGSKKAIFYLSEPEHVKAREYLETLNSRYSINNPTLIKAATSSDPERSRRAKIILNLIKKD